MADVIFGGTLRYMPTFKMLEARPAFESYVERISARPASQAAQAKTRDLTNAPAHPLAIECLPIRALFTC